MKKIILFLFAFFCVVVAQAQSDSLAIDKDDEIVDYAEKTAAFPGGPDSMQKFIHKYVLYPSQAIMSKIQGTVLVSFVVEKDGSISDIKRRGKEVGGGCDEEAVRVISLFPKFKPALQNGIPVRLRMTVPIRFRLN